MLYVTNQVSIQKMKNINCNVGTCIIVVDILANIITSAVFISTKKNHKTPQRTHETEKADHKRHLKKNCNFPMTKDRSPARTPPKNP